MDAERQLDVLAGEGRRVAADLLEHVAAPDLEAAGGTEHEPPPGPRQAVVDECADEVEVLVHAEEAVVDPRLPGGCASTFSGSAAVAIWLVTPITRAGSLIGNRMTCRSAVESNTVSASTPHT